jgi:hypothetical protein
MINAKSELSKFLVALAFASLFAAFFFLLERVSGLATPNVVVTFLTVLASLYIAERYSLIKR